MGAPAKPMEDLDPPGRQIREARKNELNLSAEAFGRLLNYDGSHIRNVELGKTGYGGLAKRCEQVAITCEVESTARVLNDLAKFLRSFRADATKAIDPRRGTERKQEQGRTVEALVGEWRAIWQTCRNGEEAWVGETVVVTVLGNGRGLRMENREDSRWLKAGEAEYVEEPGKPNHLLRWSAACRMTKDGRWVNGEFTSLAEAKVDGLFRLRVDNFPEVMVGDWLGESWDSERTHGLLVLARDGERAETRFAQERGKVLCFPFSST